MKNTTTQFSSTNLPKLIQRNLQLVLLGAIALVVLLGTFIATQLSQQDQDNRNQASVDGGDVIVTGRQNPLPFVGDGSQGEVILSANSAGLNVGGFVFAFKISADTSNSSPVDSISVESLTETTGDVVGFRTTENSDGTTDVVFALLDPSLSAPFSSSTPVDLAKIKFNVFGPGPLTFTFDNEVSSATLPLPEDSDIAEEVLAPLSPMTFSIVLAENPTSTIEPTVTQCAQPTQPLCQSDQHLECTNTPNSAVCSQCNCIDNDEATPTPTPTTGANTPTITPTPTDDGTGGTTLKYCGESCSSHPDCAVNLMCYAGVCRLANNPTDRYCNSPADNGIHRVCNEYCADSRECNTGLTCYYNRCRNPRNVSDQYCSEPVTYVAPQTKVITNTKTVTKTVIVTATPLPFGSTDPIENTTTEVTPEWALPTNTLWPTLPPVSVTPEPETEEVTLLTRIQGWLKGLLILALLMGAAVFLLWLLPILLKRGKDDDDQPPTPTRMSDTDSTPQSHYEDEEV